MSDPVKLEVDVSDALDVLYKTLVAKGYDVVLHEREFVGTVYEVRVEVSGKRKRSRR